MKTLETIHQVYSSAHKEIVRGGKAYFTLLLKLISNAAETIHLQTYILQDDETGSVVAEALKQAAARKVKVYIVADGYASRHLSAAFIKDLKSAGVHFRFFQPFFKTEHFYFGRRLHHKIFTADQQHALVGGINIADRYNDINGTPAWLDFAIYTTGPVVDQLQERCAEIYRNTFRGDATMHSLPQTEGLHLLPAAQHIRMRCNDWVGRKNEISASYVSLFSQARSRITIMCSYFLPGRILRNVLRRASQRGVEIRLIMAGPTDVRIAKHAERWLYDWLLRNKIQIYEYQPTVLHAKLAICDDSWFTIGSYNLNNISAYASIELNLDIRDEELTGGILYETERIIKTDCIQITSPKQVRENIFERFFRWFAYHFIRAVLFLLTFYFKRRQLKMN